MSTEIINPEQFQAVIPLRVKRPCDYALELAMNALETQLGTIEAFNRLVDAANRIGIRIASGDTKDAIPGTANPAPTETEEKR